MKRLMTIVALGAGLIALASCSKSRLEQMEMADNVKIQCNPEILENVAGTVNATISVTYPKDYFHPEAVMTVTPVIVYDGGQVAGTPFVYQGEKVKDNNKVVKLEGGTVTETVSFKYFDGMAKCYLELRSVAVCQNKRIEIPSVKVAEGVRNTWALADVSGAYSFKEDGYQDVMKSTSEARILYNVNSAEVRNSQLSNNSVKELKAALKEIEANDRYTVTGTHIEAYASPEGGQEYNAKLSDKRAASAQKAWDKITKGMKADDFQVKSLGQDWDGFKEAIEASDIEDKDLILRVLSMYSDPAVREREIKNMSSVYTEINKKVFPELRRARLVADVEYRNFTNEELSDLADKSAVSLDEASLLRVAATSTDSERRSMLYHVAAERLGSMKAKYNLAALALDENKPGIAELYINKYAVNDPDAENIKGVVALRRGQIDAAKDIFEKLDTPDAKINLGAVSLLNGDYAKAEELLSGTGVFNEALAHLLNGNLPAAQASVAGDSAYSDYLRAVIAARQGNAQDVKKWLDSAVAKDPELKEKAAKDIEFAKFR